MRRAGKRLGRVYLSRHPDPLGFGKALSRLSDPGQRIPASRFGVRYLGSTLKVSFVEAMLRDQGDGRIGQLLSAERDLAARSLAAIEVLTPLKLVDLRGDGPLRMGTAICGRWCWSG